MKIKITAIAALAASLAVAASASAAPNAAPAAAGGLALNGPTVPGMCVLFQNQLIHDSMLGKAISTRLGQLKTQVGAEINADATQLQTDERTFETGRAAMTPDQQQKQGGALAAREQALQQKYQLRTQEVEATQDKAVGDLGAAMSATLMLVGDRLGLYRELAKGPVSASTLAQRTGTNARYVREWLGNQGAGGYVQFDSKRDTWSLSPEQALCLADPSGPDLCVRSRTPGHPGRGARSVTERRDGPRQLARGRPAIFLNDAGYGVQVYPT